MSILERPTGASRRGNDGQFDSALGWKPGLRPSNVIRFALCAVAFVVFAAPFVIIVSGAFDAFTSSTSIHLFPQKLSLESFRVAFDSGVLGYLRNSLVIAGGGLVLQVGVAILTSYALARHRFRGQSFVLLLFLLTMMLPEEVIAIPLSQVIGDVGGTGLDLRGTPFGVILPVAVWGFSILVMTEFMKDIPLEIEEAARLDGCGELRMLWTVILPLCKPVLGVVTIFGFMMIWDQYLLPSSPRTTRATTRSRSRSASSAPTPRSARASCSPGRCSRSCRASSSTCSCSGRSSGDHLGRDEGIAP